MMRAAGFLPIAGGPRLPLPLRADHFARDLLASTPSRLVTVLVGLFARDAMTNLWHDPQLLGAAWLEPPDRRDCRDDRARARARSAPYALVPLPPLPRPEPSSQATVSAPLVMPDVITGLALLLLFVVVAGRFIGWPQQRGVLDHRHRPRDLLHGLCDASWCRARLDRPRSEPRGGGDGPWRDASARVLRHHAAHHRTGADLGLAAGASRSRSTTS